jgi:hypothetical protein
LTRGLFEPSPKWRYHPQKPSFFVPFASPGKIEHQGDVNKRKAGLISLILAVSSDVVFAFCALHVAWFTNIADAGLVICLMTACYSSFPFKHLEGEKIFGYNKAFVACHISCKYILFSCIVLQVLPYVAYFLVGGFFLLVFAILLRWLKK